MPETQSTLRTQWSSRFVFLMATVGAAVGLGNLWRFPFQAGQNGGAAFVLIYFVCVVFIAMPVLIAELAIGRSQGRSAIGSIRRLAGESSRSKLWTAGGWIAVSATTLVLPVYAVIAGKIMAFSALAAAGALADPAIAEPYRASPLASVLWMSLFLGVTIAVVAAGVRRGVEAAVSILMPIFFVVLAGLCSFSLMVGDAGAAVAYLATARLTDISPTIVLAALGQALFSLAVGGAVMITYGAYADRKENLCANAAVIAGADTLVALVAGLMIFPIIFGFDLDPGTGMGLIFEALPKVFLSLPGGRVIGALFFFLAFVAALTSSISMLLIAVTTAEDEFALRRTIALSAIAALAWGLGAASALIPGVSEWLDFAIGSVLLPLGALASAVIAGWVAPVAVMQRELTELPPAIFLIWLFVMRFAAPTAIALILIAGIDAKFGLFVRLAG
ncbi:MAG: sodium-dependent transporter [Alphaproteobacteria bacterium]|nr:sodium-dependent transporter [Alphaproteobacteria bacterium]